MTTERPFTMQSTDAPPRRRRVYRRVRVTHVVQLSPRMVRVTFTGDDLASFAWSGPASHIKLVFPEAGQAEPPLPDPDGPKPARMRSYTPRRFDPTVPELDVDFVLHGAGPAASWAAQAQPGQMLILSGPGPSYQIDPAADWFLLAADDAALPAIETILDALPAHVQVRVVLEVSGEQEQRPLASAAQLEVAWVQRGPDPAQAGQALEAALRAMPFPPGSGRIYVGCEAAAMRRIRTCLMEQRGIDPAALVTRGYWKLGAVAYTDRDYGLDS